MIMSVGIQEREKLVTDLAQWLETALQKALFGRQ